MDTEIDELVRRMERRRWKDFLLTVTVSVLTAYGIAILIRLLQ